MGERADYEKILKEIFDKPRTNTIQQDVKREMFLVRNRWWYGDEYFLNMGYTQKEIDSVEVTEPPTWLKQARAWSGLATKVVGAEA